jgi:hypothetical protein
MPSTSGSITAVRMRRRRARVSGHGSLKTNLGLLSGCQWRTSRLTVSSTRNIHPTMSESIKTILAYLASDTSSGIACRVRGRRLKPRNRHGPNRHFRRFPVKRSGLHFQCVHLGKVGPHTLNAASASQCSCCRRTRSTRVGRCSDVVAGTTMVRSKRTGCSARHALFFQPPQFFISTTGMSPRTHTGVDSKAQ